MLIQPLKRIFTFRCHHCSRPCQPCHIVVAVTTATLTMRRHFCTPACVRGWLGPG